MADPNAQSGQAGPLPFLEFCGFEISNGARTIEYLRNGLANTRQGNWMVDASSMCSVLYRLAAGPTFVSPSIDPAPWYDSTESGSSAFLGAVMIDIKGYDGTIQRQLDPVLGGLGGGLFASQRRVPRVWKFRAALISADDSGAEFGLRWLEDALQSNPCATCDACYLLVRLACPPADGSNDTLGEWISYEVALTDGPHEVDAWGPGRPQDQIDSLGACRDFVIVEWQMTAANPFLYKRAKACLAATTIAG